MKSCISLFPTSCIMKSCEINLTFRVPMLNHSCKKIQHKNNIIAGCNSKRTVLLTNINSTSNCKAQNSKITSPFSFWRMKTFWNVQPTKYMSANKTLSKLFNRYDEHVQNMQDPSSHWGRNILPLIWQLIRSVFYLIKNFIDITLHTSSFVKLSVFSFS